MGFFKKTSSSSVSERFKEKPNTRIQEDENQTKIIENPCKNVREKEVQKNFGTRKTKQTVKPTNSTSQDAVEEKDLSRNTVTSVQSVKKSKRLSVKWSLFQQNADKSLLSFEDFCIKPYKKQSGKYYFKCKMGERCKKSS